MSALEVEGLLQKLAALREPTGDWPLGTGLELQDLYTILKKIHDKVRHAEPLVDRRSSAAYSLFTADLRRVAVSVDEALDKFLSSTSLSSRISRILYHLLWNAHCFPWNDDRSVVYGSSRRQRRRQQGRRTSGTASSSQGPWSSQGPTQGVQIVSVVQPLVAQGLVLVLRPKVADQFKEAQRDLQMLLRLFSTYVADFLPKHRQQMVFDSNNPLGETSSSRFQKQPNLIGRKQDMENVMRILIDAETEVVAVVGTAGAGKTALVREVFDKYEGFDHRLWIPVSQDFDPERIFRGMMTLLSDKLKRGEDPESYWWSMKEGLVNKKYLVVLDDVWNEDQRKWKQLLHLLSGKKTSGSKIVVSTRIPAAAAAIQSVTTYNLLPLPIEDSIEWLNAHIGNSFKSENCDSSVFKGSIIRKFAERCSASPKLFDFMKSFPNQDIFQGEAMHAVEEFDAQCMSDIALLGVAESSYKHLPSHLQRCFLYCSLFPPEHIFEAEEMTSLWVAEGLISSKEAQMAGNIIKLMDECFYIFYKPESGGQTWYKMQFLLHNFARNKGKNQYTATRIENYTSLREQFIRYMSLIVDPKTKELPALLIEQKELRTLILVRRQEMVLCCQRSEIREIPSDYCRYLTALRVLDLHATKIDRLPGTFDMLSNLRYLNLSQTDIVQLPESFEKLQNLIYLNMAETSVAAFPESISKIKSLRYLNLSRTGIRKLPDIFGDLRSLQTLQLSHCKKLVKVPDSIGSLTNLQKLDLEGCHYLSEMPHDISNMKNLKELNILECSSLDRMPVGLNTLTKIEALPRYIAPISNEGTILELQGLINLKILGLQNLERVSSMDAEEKWLERTNKLQALTLHWNIHFVNSTEEAEELPDSVRSNQENTSPYVEQKSDGSRPFVAEIIAESLQPNKNLKTLEIISYGGRRFPNWMMSLPNLVQIRLVNVKCKMLPPLGVLPLLAIAEISGMDAMDHVCSELNGGNGRSFRSLKKLTFSQMFNLESWPADGATCPCLEELSIIQCPKFQNLSTKLPIKKLTVWMGPHGLLAAGGLTGVVGSLKGLSISLCEELSSSSNIEGLTALSCLEDLAISGCDELESFPPEFKNLVSLKRLSVIGCSELRDLSCLLDCSHLTSLVISGCPVLTSVPEGLEGITKRE